MRIALLLVTGCGFTAEVEREMGTPAGPDAAMPMQPASCDLDNDGVCDDQTWRCGAPPTGPGENPLFGDPLNEALWSHEVSLAGKGRFVVAVAGKTISLSLDYDWRVDCPGASCQAQVEYGLVGTGFEQRFGCLADRQMADRLIAWDQDGDAMIAVPAAPGIYDVRLEINKGAACDTSWQTPGGSHTIAKLCVP